MQTKKRNGAHRNQRGMTLIEIMVVIAIIAGLLTALGTKVMDSYEKSKFQQSVIQLKNVESALQAYALDCGGYPSEDAGLGALVSRPSAEVCANWGPSAYLRESQTKDAYNRDYRYSTGNGTFVVAFLGRDGKPGGKDLDRDVSTEESEVAAK